MKMICFSRTSLLWPSDLLLPSFSLLNSGDINEICILCVFTPKLPLLATEKYQYVVRGNCDLPSTRTCSIPSLSLSQEAPLCSASPPPFARQDVPSIFDFWFHFPFPVSVLAFSFWSRDVGSAVPLRDASPIFRLRLLSSLPFSAALRQFGAMTIGTNGPTCGFN